MTTRQPKGTPVGGQFAPERKPNGGDLIDPIDAAVDRDPVDPAQDVTMLGQSVVVDFADQPDQDEAYHHCGACGDDTDVASSTCPNCGSDLALVSYSMPEAGEGTRQKYVDAITTGYAEIAKLMPSFDVSRYLPNNEGVRLLKESSLVITQEMDTHDGVAWTGTLKVGDVVLNVEQEGRGGSNRYWTPDGRKSWRLEEELSARVASGFPGLAGSGDELDDLCGILEMIQDVK